MECVSLTISYHLCFLHISIISRKLYHRSVGSVGSMRSVGSVGFRVQSRDCYFMVTYIFFGKFFKFHQKIYVFIISISFFDEVLNFCNGILASQKPELVIRNCVWDCMDTTSIKNNKMWCVVRFGTLLYNFKKVKNTHGKVLILVKLQV